MHTPMLDAGFNVNTMFDGAIDRDQSVIEYCRIHDVTLQCWSPFQYGMFEGVFLNNEKFPEVNRVIDELAAQLWCQQQFYCRCLVIKASSQYAGNIRFY